MQNCSFIAHSSIALVLSLVSFSALAGNDPGCPSTASDGVHAPCAGYLPSGAESASEASGVHYLSEKQRNVVQPSSQMDLRLLPQSGDKSFVMSGGVISLEGGYGQQIPSSAPMCAEAFCAGPGYSSGGKQWVGWENLTDLSSKAPGTSYTATQDGWQYRCVYTPQPSRTCKRIVGWACDEFGNNCTPIYEYYTIYGEWVSSCDNGYWELPPCENPPPPSPPGISPPSPPGISPPSPPGILSKPPGILSKFGNGIRFTGISVLQNADQARRGVVEVVYGIPNEDFTGWKEVHVEVTYEQLMTTGVTHTGVPYGEGKAGVIMTPDGKIIIKNDSGDYLHPGVSNEAVFDLNTGQITPSPLAEEQLLAIAQAANEYAYQNSDVKPTITTESADTLRGGVYVSQNEAQYENGQIQINYNGGNIVESITKLQTEGVTLPNGTRVMLDQNLNPVITY